MSKLTAERRAGLRIVIENDPYLMDHERADLLALLNASPAPISVAGELIDREYSEDDGPPAPTLSELRGIAPNCTGGLSSEEFVRRIRQGWIPPWKEPTSQERREMLGQVDLQINTIQRLATLELKKDQESETTVSQVTYQRHLRPWISLRSLILATPMSAEGGDAPPAPKGEERMTMIRVLADMEAIVAGKEPASNFVFSVAAQITIDKIRALISAMPMSAESGLSAPKVVSRWHLHQWATGFDEDIAHNEKNLRDIFHDLGIEVKE